MRSRWQKWSRRRGALTGKDLLLRCLRGLNIGALRCGCPVDGWRPGEPDDDRLESNHVTGAWVPGWWHEVWIVRLIYGCAVRLKSDAPRRRSANAVVHLARVWSKHVDRHHSDVQGMVVPLFVRFGRHRQHSVGTPPSDNRPRPADRITLQHGGTVEGDDDGRALLANNICGPRGWVCTAAGTTSTRVREVELEVEEQEEREDEEEHQPTVRKHMQTLSVS